MNERLSKTIDDRVEDLVALTADLIRFPTVNPPGEAYTPCAEYIAARLKKRRFETQFIRGHDTPGDTDRYPRTNVVARFDGYGGVTLGGLSLLTGCVADTTEPGLPPAPVPCPGTRD